MEIKILKPNSAEMYRRIRLKALQSNPEVFSSSYDEEKEYPLEKFESRLKGDESFTFGAFDNEQLVGVVTLVIEKKNKLKHRATIFAMYVYPEKRRAGYGKNLMIEAIKKAKKIERIEQIYLAVVSNNEPAKNLYKSLGFETYGIDKNALKVDNTYFDDELMVLFV
ncbi:GNAT family N-acetyltransferase [Neobacillus sp. PS3-40]|uniref:GNAT family N-acetyltransferase n=1 Tax=Neobacillus sp. PS3-40 TaxID=3070679 RepID=UPI0027E1A032|nr:GNAT family N-acetyltransferase [Neobacillus sp. PS3-40]WML44160.1 GNAT family N-acetyltransferase [Neobacillus sp. PS3-40]